MQYLNYIHEGGNQNTHKAIIILKVHKKKHSNHKKSLTVHVTKVGNLMTFKISKANYVKE